eukprot:7216257-Alexandrium_andersonii.AAC.1
MSNGAGAACSSAGLVSRKQCSVCDLLTRKSSYFRRSPFSFPPARVGAGAELGGGSGLGESRRVEPCPRSSPAVSVRAVG